MTQESGSGSLRASPTKPAAHRVWRSARNAVRDSSGARGKLGTSSYAPGGAADLGGRENHLGALPQRASEGLRVRLAVLHDGVVRRVASEPNQAAAIDLLDPDVAIGGTFPITGVRYQ